MITVNQAVSYLKKHYIQVTGTTDNGVCVVEELGKDGMLYTQTVWLPCDAKTIRNWLGY